MIAGLSALMLVVSVSGWAAQEPAGQSLFAEHCAQCHRPDSGTRAPLPDVLHQMTNESILRALESGAMKQQGATLTDTERHTLADYLGRASSPQASAAIGACSAGRPMVKNDPGWGGWGVDPANDRYQRAVAADLRPDQVSQLKLKWAFGFPGASSAFGQPVVTGGRLYVGSEDGTVYSLDATTGCVDWTYKAEATVKAAVSVSPDERLAFFGDTNGRVYAVSAATGSLVWKTVVDPHPAAHHRVATSPGRPPVRTSLFGRRGLRD